jgi:hypothetical protein
MSSAVGQCFVNAGADDGVLASAPTFGARGDELDLNLCLSASSSFLQAPRERNRPPGRVVPRREANARNGRDLVLLHD